MDIMETIREQIEGNRIILYMKGSPNQPQCGFSARTVQAVSYTHLTLPTICSV